MKKALPFLFISFLIIISSAATAVVADEPYDPPTLNVEMPTSITPNSDISIKVNIQNTTGTRMWRSKVYIDVNSIPSNIRQYLEFFDTEEYLTYHLAQQGFKDVLYPDEEADVAFRIKANSNIPALTIPIYIVLETEIGLCDEGCAPYRRTMEYDITVLRDDPNLFLELGMDEVRLNVGDCYIAKGNFSMTYSITNTSQTSAFNVELSVEDTLIPLSSTITPQMPITIIKPENGIDGTLYVATGNISPGTYTIKLDATYDDFYGKTFSTSDSFAIVVVSNAYELLEQGELFLLSCEYENALSSFEQARALYEEVEYTELSTRCYQRTEYVNGILMFFEAQDLYHAGSYSEAKDSYELAKIHYQNANDCTGASLCSDAIFSIENMGAGGQTSVEDDNGGFSLLEIALSIIVLGLIGLLALSTKGKK